MSTLQSRPAWRKLTTEQQLAVAKTAAEHGQFEAARIHVVSVTAVRNACARTGIQPKRIKGVDDKASRIKQARSLLRNLRLTPRDLIEEGGAS